MGRAGEKEEIVEGFELGPRETAYQHPTLGRCDGHADALRVCYRYLMRHIGWGISWLFTAQSPSAPGPLPLRYYRSED